MTQEDSAIETPSRDLRVVSPGVLSTVQDCGRRGVARMGVTPSGAADQYSARAANRLVGNDECAATIEITLTGASFELLAATRCAVTGAAALIEIDGARVPTWHSQDVQPGARLTVGPATRGARSYLALNGGIAVSLVFGSAATDVGAGFGGFEGRALRAGDLLTLGPSTFAQTYSNPADSSAGPLAYPPESIPHWAPSATLRILAGPQRDMLSDHAFATFLKRTYNVSSRSTRQGVQLDGEPLDLDRPMDIASAGAVVGSVQLTSAGLPLLLLADHQTTGGYATIACVISADISRAAQLRPKDQVHFELVTQVDAVHAMQAAARMLTTARADVETHLAGGFHEGI